MDDATQREQRQDEWRRSALYGPGGPSIDPRSVYPSYPSRVSILDREEEVE